MANRPLTMNKIRQILRGHFEGRGSKQLSQLTGVARNTVKSYLRRFKETGLTYHDAEQLSDEVLSELILGPPAPQQQSKRQEILSALLPAISKELRRKGMTQQRLWEDYIAKHPQGYRCSQFKAYLGEYLNRRSLTMHFEHKAGDKVFIDYAGKPLYITDPETGEHIPVQVFLGVLGCSQYTYMEATLTQKQEDFTESCRRMLEYYGGVPRAIVPDNLKSAVQRGSKYSPVINETFESFAEHYNTSILPTRPRQPREKSLVEGAVKLVYQRIYLHLQSKVFFSLEGLNEAIRPLLASYNERALRGEESRREQFEQLERESLQALPALPYQLMQVKISTVMKNTHICLAVDKHYYSVPHQFIGKKVKVLYNDDRVEVFYRYHRIAQHKRDRRKHKYTTSADHLATSQRYVSSWSYDYFVGEGSKISREVGDYLAALMETKPHAEQGYKSCAGILHLAKKAGNSRLIQACKRAAEYGIYTYPIIEDILSKNLDTLSLTEEQLDDTALTPRHHNIRGKEYYS